MQKLTGHGSGFDLIENPPPERDEHNATHLPLGGWCEHCVVISDFSHTMQFRWRARSADGLLLHGPQLGQRADDGAQLPGLRVRTYVRSCRRPLISVISNRWDFCGRKRVVLRTDDERAISALSTAVCQARTKDTIRDNLPKAFVSQHRCN